MKEQMLPKTLRLIINNQWLVDSITGLGSGYQIHLVYPNPEIAPEVLLDIESGSLNEGVLGEIIHCGPKASRLVATVETSQVNTFPNYIRFDLRILETTPFVRDGAMPQNTKYQCFYR